MCQPSEDGMRQPPGLTGERLKMEKVVKKLNRIEGQIGGIRRMCEENKSCLEVVQQVAAVRSALTGVAKDLLSSEACLCAKDQKKQKDFDRVIKSLLDISS